jgi:hypothetical protein
MRREEAVADHVITTAAMERRNKIVSSDLRPRIAASEIDSRG